MGIELGCEFGNNNFKSSKIEIDITIPYSDKMLTMHAWNCS